MTSVSINTDPTEFDPDIEQILPWRGAYLPSFLVKTASSYLMYLMIIGLLGEWGRISFEPVMFFGGSQGINFA